MDTLDTPEDPMIGHRLPLAATLALALFAAGCNGDARDEDPTYGPAPTGLADDLTGLVSYDVVDGALGDPTFIQAPANLEAEQQDTETQARIWTYASRVFRSHMRWMSSFVVFTDGADGTLAQVFTLADSPRQWALAVDYEDSLDQNGEPGGPDLAFTLVHEFGHVVSLNADQIAFDPDLAAGDDAVIDAKRSQCDTTFLDEGCSKPGSYIHAFHEAFWSDLAAEEEAAEAADDSAEEAAAAALYARFPERFVSEYAATNLAEDFAESFSHYVMLPEPDGDAQKDDKVRFFADYPELVTIRDQIRAAGFHADAADTEALRVAPHARRRHFGR
jgi:hypothetical protein